MIGLKPPEGDNRIKKIIALSLSVEGEPVLHCETEMVKEHYISLNQLNRTERNRVYLALKHQIDGLGPRILNP